MICSAEFVCACPAAPRPAPNCPGNSLGRRKRSRLMQAAHDHCVKLTRNLTWTGAHAEKLTRPARAHAQSLHAKLTRNLTQVLTHEPYTGTKLTRNLTQVLLRVSLTQWSCAACVSRDLFRCPLAWIRCAHTSRATSCRRCRPPTAILPYL